MNESIENQPMTRLPTTKVQRPGFSSSETPQFVGPMTLVIPGETQV